MAKLVELHNELIGKLHNELIGLADISHRELRTDLIKAGVAFVLSIAAVFMWCAFLIQICIGMME